MDATIEKYAHWELSAQTKSRRVLVCRWKEKRMHVFVSTQETQGSRTNDFCYVPEGEIVIFSVLTCTGEQADDDCGCARSMCGIETHKPTTTMKVVPFTSSRAHLEYLVRTALREAGWDTIVRSDLATDYAARIIHESNMFEPGTVVEYRDGAFSARKSEE